MNNDASWFWFKLTILLFSYGSGQQRINNTKKYRQIAGDFNCHGDPAVQCRAHRIQGFTRSYRIPLLVECLLCIALAVAMVNKFE
jgi:hypothetical protein